jgi:5S rRNA maturation endonuclease (ribonuclease M5)
MQDSRESRKKGTYDLEALEELISALKEASDRGAVIIVEGMRDEKALRALGIEGPVIMASRRPALDLAEMAARRYSEVVILTDWDEKGDEISYNLKRHLRSAGARFDVDIRGKLRSLVKKEIKDVESLSRYVEKMRENDGS